MLRNQAKKQCSFYVCASCRRQHSHDLAQLRSTGRIRTTSPSSTSRPFSSASATIVMRPAVQGQRNRSILHGMLSKATRVDAKGYSSWGKFGSPSLPGQSNSAWGRSSNSSQPTGTPSSSPAWGVASKIPSATGTSAWGGASRTQSSPMMPAWAQGQSKIPLATGTTAEGGAGRLPQSPNATTPIAPRRIDSPGNPKSIPTVHEPTVDIQKGEPQRSTVSIHWPAGGQPSETRHSEAAPGSHPSFIVPQGSTHQDPTPARAPDAAFYSSDSVPNQPRGTPWGKGAPGAFPTALGGLNGAVPKHSGFGAPALGSQLGATSSTPASGISPGTVSQFGGPAGWSPGKPMFGGPSASTWTPRKTSPAPSSVPAKGASADSWMTPARSKSGLDAANWDQNHSIGPSPSWKDAAAISFTNKAVSQSQTADPISDTIFTKPPVRKPPPGAEFPQLQRRGSRDDMFEAMSPFNLPSKQQWGRHKIPPAGSAQNTFTRERPSRSSPRNDRRNGQPPRRDRYPDWSASTKSQSDIGVSRPPPEATEAGRSDVSTVSNSTDQFELMNRAAVMKEKGMGKFDHTDWDEGLIPTGLGKPVRLFTDQSIALSDGTRRGRDSEGDTNVRGRGRGFDREADTRGRGRGSDRENKDYTGRGRDDKRKKFGGNRKRNTDEDEDIEEYDGYQEARALRKQRQRRLEEERAAEEAAAPKTIRLPEYITVYDLAEALRIKPAIFLRDLEQLGFENTLHDSVMTGETAALVAAEYGFEPTVESGLNVDLRPRPPPEDVTSVPPRPPIVTIMGHVDHGKTTILDTLRKSSIVAQEFGGITQHIGAFSVKLSTGKAITFLDTPGHAAFLSMRQRGANVTDIVVLVVAVDDSVKPQTIEAIKHAQSAKVPMIVAINKIDVDNTPNRIDMVKQDLANHGVELEDYGGDVQVVAMSGKTGLGMRDLEDAILTLSEVLDMRAEIDGMAEGWVLEASIKPDGRAATILVKRGTLRIGDLIVAGTAYTKVRIMRNEAGVDVEEAGPGTPIEIYGTWKGEPMAGDMVLQAPDEPKAQAAADYRQEIAERAIAAAQNAEREAQDREKAEREFLKKKMEAAEESGESDDAEPIEVGPKLVSIIVKGDVMGSVEAVSMAIQEIGNNEVRPRILRVSPGQITESDVDHMATAKGAIVNFNTTIPTHVLQRANKAGVVILNHNIIYETVQAVKDLLSAQLKPIYTQRVLAEAQVAQIFPINITKRKYKNIAGVKVTNGKLTRGGHYRVMRDREEVYKGKLAALKQNKDDVTEVRKGIECGVMFDEFDDFREGDLIQLFEDVEQPRYL